MKSQWPELGLTLDAAAFHYDFDNLQTVNPYFVDDELIVEIDNAAKAEVYGIDAAASLQATAQLSLTAAFVWLPKREYGEYIVSEDGQDLSGYELPRAPEWSAIGSITYRWPLAHYGELTGRVEYSYRSGFFYTLDNLATESQPAYGLLNLLLRFEPPQANWYAFAAGRNLTDGTTITRCSSRRRQATRIPMRVGVGVRFEGTATWRMFVLILSPRRPCWLQRCYRRTRCAGRSTRIQRFRTLCTRKCPDCPWDLPGAGG
jgi:outer membrane receptor protein involved in Fe transport